MANKKTNNSDVQSLLKRAAKKPTPKRAYKYSFMVSIDADNHTEFQKLAKKAGYSVSKLIDRLVAECLDKVA